MRIENSQHLRNGLINREPEETTAPSPKPADEQTKSNGTDRLDLSVSARAAALSSEESGIVSAASEDISAERLAEIKQRIKSGAYDSGAVLSKTADSLLNFYSA